MATSSSHTNSVAIGARFSVSAGVRFLILIIVFIFVRCRKARKHSETIGADIMVARPHDVGSMKRENSEKEIGKEKDVRVVIVRLIRSRCLHVPLREKYNRGIRGRRSMEAWAKFEARYEGMIYENGTNLLWKSLTIYLG